MASNTPTLLLDYSRISSKLSGIYPPLSDAVKISRTRNIAILGTRSVIQSESITEFIEKCNVPNDIVIHKIDCSLLVELVESGKFLKLLHDVENIAEKSSVIGGYASLRYSENTQSDEATALLTRISKFGSDIENRLLFFDLWWKRQVDEKNAKRLIKSAGQFSEYLKFKRLLAKYSLSEPEEKIINTLDVTGVSALVKLYDKITNAYVYTVAVDGKKRTMNREQLTTLVRSKKAKTREAAYKS